MCSRCGCAGVLIIVICYCTCLVLSCSAIGQAHHKMLTPLCQTYVAFVGTGLKVGVKLGEPGRQKLDRQRFWTMQSRVLSYSSPNPFTAVLITTPSLGNRPIKAPDLK